jgi:hypothetical protein
MSRPMGEMGSTCKRVADMRLHPGHRARVERARDTNGTRRQMAPNHRYPTAGAPGKTRVFVGLPPSMSDTEPKARPSSLHRG